MVAAQSFFLPAREGARYCIYHEACHKPALGAVVYVPPFAEEMNKSRRMAAMQARRLAEAGFSVIQMDLLGCGDSSGDLIDADWDCWRQDICLATSWLRTRTAAPLWFWGMRLGALLAASSASLVDEPVNLVFWQPVVRGQQYLQQFLRLKLAGELLDGGGKAAMEKIRGDLASGLAVEVAGYGLSARLAGELVAQELTLPPNVDRVVWLEVSSRPTGELSPVAQRAIANWQALGRDVTSRILSGPAFWQTAEIEEAPELLTATVDALVTVAP